jgi:hypothetical protein
MLVSCFSPDPQRHDYRDVPASELQEFMGCHGFNSGIFEHGCTIESLAIFEEEYKISVNIYDIGKNGPEETKVYYCSIYNGDPDVTKVNLGISRDDEEGEVHFVLVRKLHVIFTEANASCRHVKMCQDCGIVCNFLNIIKLITKMKLWKNRYLCYLRHWRKHGYSSISSRNMIFIRHCDISLYAMLILNVRIFRCKIQVRRKQRS